VKVDTEAFEEALVRLVLEVPLTLRVPRLSLLDDGMRLGEWDKLGIALALSLEPLKESIARAVENTLAPQLFYTVIATGLITWAILAANPEPVFTKAAAIVSAVEGSTVIVSLPATAVAMTAQGLSSAAAGVSPAGFRS